MLVEAERRNRFDPNAMVVRIPSLEDIPTNFHMDITKEKKGNENEQTVKSIAGKTVGRVPANLCKLLRGFSQKKVKVKCFSTGPPSLSSNPPAQRSFKKNFGRNDREGGGAIIPCKYLLNIPDNEFFSVKAELVAFFGLTCGQNVIGQQVFSCPW